MATSGNGGRPFPEDLTVDILLRLPVESLLRFKCVCKNWYEIMKSHSFIREHMHWNSKSKSPQILIYDHSAPHDSPPITFVSVSDAGVLENPPDYLQGFRGMTYLLGSVDGLFLLEREIDGSIFDISLSLWNPATREVRPLPAANFELQPSFKQMDRQFGFGLDPMTNDYKVVWFRSFWDDIGNHTIPRQYAAVYSCSKDSWRILEPTNLIHEFCVEAFGTAYLNGTYYWLLGGGSCASNDCSVLSFDFGNEVFAEIGGPDVGRAFNHRNVRLVLLDDFIALMTVVEGFVYDIWVMIQPGVWNKQFTFQCTSYIKSWYSSALIFVNKRSHLFSYDVRTQTTRNLGFRHPGLRRTIWKTTDGCSVHFYKESLVTIKRENRESNH
uniref:F-box/kelch-repeat protein At3g23880-like n=1 Tax=Nicotiana sylvestris TaxID=4096 RepID=A0A1U7XLD4_NICSY|nr:PREDICTED: F-box/kelch-repeat protein At3g23880-like [Nicotiana sylvestris]